MSGVPHTHPLHHQRRTNPLVWLLLGMVHLYQWTLSPLLHFIAPGSGCRFIPSCSQYAIEAIRTHGAAKGSWLAIKRIARCHPWGGCGPDPVPLACQSIPDTKKACCEHHIAKQSHHQH